MTLNDILNAKTVTLLVIVIFAAGVGTYFYEEQQSKTTAIARDALYQAEKVFQEEYDAMTADQKAPGAQINVDSVFPKTISAMKSVIEKSAVEQVRFEASVQLGALYLDHGQKALAYPYFEGAQKFARTDFQKASSALLIGIAGEDKPDAQKELETVIQSKVDGLKPEAYLALIRISTKSQKPNDAKNYFEKMKKDLGAAANNMMGGNNWIDRAESILKAAHIQ